MAPALVARVAATFRSPCAETPRKAAARQAILKAFPKDPFVRRWPSAPVMKLRSPHGPAASVLASTGRIGSVTSVSVFSVLSAATDEHEARIARTLMIRSISDAVLVVPHTTVARRKDDAGRESLAPRHLSPEFMRNPDGSRLLGCYNADQASLRRSSLAMLTAMRRASSRVTRFAAARRHPGKDMRRDAGCAPVAKVGCTPASNFHGHGHAAATQPEGRGGRLISPSLTIISRVDV